MTTYIEQLQSIFQMILAQSTFLLPYLPTIQLVGIIVSLLICIAGYKIRKLCDANSFEESSGKPDNYSYNSAHCSDCGWLPNPHIT